ncbi:MAG: ATPase [Gammaproteobacteria bacterium RIFCSPHIGHO2_01_FULL_42_8]|nr:MAG: ATPase [Gammaproteobacteria bacterium RIFCSPHIGHO2_01_FULL_42_8]
MPSKLIHRFFQDPGTHYFLFGPRGTGKSTWITEHYGDRCLLIDMLQPDVFRYYQAKPERLYDTVKAHSDRPVIVIDEVEKVPDVLTVVHSLIEKKLNKHFVLTGSSARKLKRSGVDLLGGRALLRHMHPFMAAELQTSFDLSSALKIGLLPLILGAKNSENQLKAYINTYLQLEVQSEGLVRNIGDFVRFLEAISFSHASLLNISNVARECEVERKTVAGYVSILEDLLLSFQVSVFSKRAKRQLIQHTKFYLFDAGVYQSLRPAGPIDTAEEMQGAALEGLVAQHLRAWIDYSNNDCQLYFWRTKSGVEVDFVVYGPKQFIAIEVKNATQAHSKDMRGLKSFKEDYPEAQIVLLYRGKTKTMVDGILCLPCDEFLKNLYPGKLISAR